MKSIYKKNHKFYLATFNVAYFETSFKQKMSSVIEYNFSWKLLCYQRSINMDDLTHFSGVFQTRSRLRFPIDYNKCHYWIMVKKQDAV